MMAARGSRYVMREHHGRTLIFDTLVGQYIDRDLWEQRMVERREDWADHDFRIGALLDGEHPENPWRLCHAVCHRCGERRRVWAGVERRHLNAMWCRPTLWQRFTRVLSP